MKRLEYTPEALRKLKRIKEEVTINYGNEIANKVVKKIVNSLQDLQVFDNKGSSVEKVIGIICDYRMLYVQHNYVFYTVTKDKVIIVDIYNEKEDFMWKLFGVQTRLQDTDDYWNE